MCWFSQSRFSTQMSCGETTFLPIGGLSSRAKPVFLSRNSSSCLLFQTPRYTATIPTCRVPVPAQACPARTFDQGRLDTAGAPLTWLFDELVPRVRQVGLLVNFAHLVVQAAHATTLRTAGMSKLTACAFEYSCRRDMMCTVHRYVFDLTRVRR